MRALVSTTALLAFVSGIQALADCDGYKDACDNYCNSIAGLRGNGTCTDYYAGCVCDKSWTFLNSGTTANVKSKAEEFCSSMKSACYDIACNGGIVNSGTCDVFSMSAQCTCSGANGLPLPRNVTKERVSNRTSNNSTNTRNNTGVRVEQSGANSIMLTTLTTLISGAVTAGLFLLA